MFSLLILTYTLSLTFILFDLNVLFINEEFLIFICMSILFFLLFTSARKFINFSFFLRIEFIYFFFIYLILLNIKLIEKMLNLISIENLKLDSLILVELYNFFSESVKELSNSEKLISLFLTKNIVALMNTNIFSSLLLYNSSDFIIKHTYFNNTISKLIELKDINYSSITVKNSINNTFKFLISSSLYDLYLIETTSINNNDFVSIFAIDNSNLFQEANEFNNSLLINLIK